jgi:hypothetical protein
MASGDEGPGRAGFGVLAADGAAGLVGDGGRGEEVERGGGGDDLDGPAAVLGQLDAGADRGRRAGAAGHDGQDMAAGCHLGAPILVANCSGSRRVLAGARVQMSVNPAKARLLTGSVTS